MRVNVWEKSSLKIITLFLMSGTIVWILRMRTWPWHPSPAQLGPKPLSTWKSSSPMLHVWPIILTGSLGLGWFHFSPGQWRGLQQPELRPPRPTQSTGSPSGRHGRGHPDQLRSLALRSDEVWQDSPSRCFFLQDGQICLWRTGRWYLRGSLEWRCSWVWHEPTWSSVTGY